MTHYRDHATARKIARYIKRFRENKFPGWGGKSIAAKEFGTAPSTWSQWESGKAVPNDVTQRRLAAFFGVSLAALRGDHDSPPISAADSELATLDEVNARAGVELAMGRVLTALSLVMRGVGAGTMTPEDATARLDAALVVLSGKGEK